MDKNSLVIYTDGGSRGNPGPAACAFVVEKNGSEIFRDSKFLGEATNNFAEYHGVILAIDWIEKNSSATFYLDSELVVRQLNGVYKVKNENIKKLHSQIIKIIDSKNLNLVFKSVPRVMNKIADGLVNLELDKNSA